jgi:hypothetical protein
MGQLPFKYKNFTGFEYLDIQRNGIDLQRLTAEDLKGITPKLLQEMIGEKHGAGKCRISGVDSKGLRYTTIFKGINKDMPIVKTDDSKINQVLDQFKKLESKLNSASQSGGITFEMLMASTKQGYEAQAVFLNQQIKYKDELITELKRDVDELERDLTDCEKESSKNSGIGQYLAIGEKILNMKFGSGTKVSLKESNSSDIPQEILLVLGVIDWSKVDPESINRIAASIQQYISVIPKEYFKGQ